MPPCLSSSLGFWAHLVSVYYPKWFPINNQSTFTEGSTIILNEVRDLGDMMPYRVPKYVRSDPQSDMRLRMTNAPRSLLAGHASLFPKCSNGGL